LRKPFSNCTRWATVNSNSFIFPMYIRIYYNRTERRNKYLI
jgi:hypothetical protein